MIIRNYFRKKLQTIIKRNMIIDTFLVDIDLKSFQNMNLLSLYL